MADSKKTDWKPPTRLKAVVAFMEKHIMHNMPLLFVVVSLTVFSLQFGCSKRVAPVSGAVEMEKMEASAARPGFKEGSRKDTDGQSTNGFNDASEDLREEAIREENINEEQLGANGTGAGIKESISSSPTISVKLGDIFFEYNMAVLKGASELALRENAKKLLRHPTTKIKISGHTDERGSGEYNLALGERRARTVKQFLEAFGIAPNRIEIISYGEEKPFCREQEESCWKENRRVHFSVKPQG